MRAILVAAFTVLVAGAAPAATAPRWRPPRSLARDLIPAAVAVNPQGGAAVALTDDSRVYAAMRRAGGRTVGSPRRLAIGTCPVVAASTAGTIVMAWRGPKGRIVAAARPPGGHFGRPRTLFRAGGDCPLLASGGRWFAVTAGGHWSRRVGRFGPARPAPQAEALAIDGQGDAVMTTLEMLPVPPDAEYSRVRVHVASNRGLGWKVSRPLTPVIQTEFLPVTGVGMANGGRYLAAFEGAERIELAAGWTGREPDAPRAVSGPLRGSTTVLRAAVAPTGAGLVAWTGERGTPLRYVVRGTGPGARFGAARTLADLAPADGWDAALDGRGDALVAWQAERGGFVRVAAGSPGGAIKRGGRVSGSLERAGAHGADLHVARNAAGAAVAAWDTEAAAPPGAVVRSYARAAVRGR